MDTQRADIGEVDPEGPLPEPAVTVPPPAPGVYTDILERIATARRPLILAITTPSLDDMYPHLDDQTLNEVRESALLL
jgi:hypothetical protein